VRVLRTAIDCGRVQGNRPTIALVTFFVLVLVTTTWAWQGLPSSRRTRIDPAQHIVALDPRWTVTLESAPAAPAGFDSRTAYVALKNGQLVAIDLESGAVRWKVEVATTVAPAAGDGLVFAAADDAIVAFLDRSGEVAWTTAIGGAIAAPIHFDAGTLILTRSDGEMVTLRAGDGTAVWRRALGAPLAVAPAAAGDRLYAALSDGRLLALDRDSGTPIWSYALDDAATGLLALDDQLVVGTRGNRVHSLRSENARVRWTWPVGGDVAGAAIADDRRIYFVAFDNVLRAVDRSNGNIRWTQTLVSRPSGGPLLTGDVVIVPTASADIGAFRVETGSPAFTIKAASELGGVPYLREAVRPTATRLVAVSRDGMVQGFASRYEPPPVPFDTLPGTKVGS